MGCIGEFSQFLSLDPGGWEERERSLEIDGEKELVLQPKLCNKAYVASSDSVRIYSIIKIYMAIWNKLFLT